jgi:stage V sporulation protein B
MAKVSAKGGFNLFWGLAVSSIISAIGIMIVAGILTESEYGLYAIALTTPNLIQLLRDFGIDQATIKYTAQYNQENKTNKIKNILAAATTFEIIIGITLSIIVYLLSGFLAENIFNRPEITPLIQIASLTIFAHALNKIAEIAFIGFEKMHLQSTTVIVQSILKALLMIFLVISGFGVIGAIIGHTIAFLLGGIISMILFYVKIFKNLRKQNNNKLEIIQNLKKMFKYGLPLSGSIILSSVMNQFYKFLIAIYLTDQIIGNYQVAINFAVLVAFFVTPVQTIMFPAFSKIEAQKEQNTLKDVFQFSVKYGSLLIVPATFMVMALSQTIVSTLFGLKYQLTPLYLSLYIVLYLFTAFGSASSENLIKGQGRTDISLKLSILSSIIGAILALILIPIYGIPGLIATILIPTIPNLALSLWWINKHYNFTIDLKSSIKIMVASASSAVITYISITQLNLPNWITLILGAAIYFGAYIITAPLMGAINQRDIQNLKEMLKPLGPLTRIFDIPLTIIGTIIQTLHKH